MPLPAMYRPTSTPTAVDYITLDSWNATAVDDQNTEWWLTSLEGWHGTPDMRLTGIDRPLDHGQFDGPTYLAPRIITAAGTAIAPDRTTALLARDIVASLCSDPSLLYTLQVTEPGRPTRRASVRLNAATKVSEVSGTAFDWQIQFKAPDPRRYDDAETVVTLYPPTGAIGGLTLPFTTPFTYTTTGAAASSTTVTNAGTIAARPVVYMWGPLVDPEIANLTAGRTLSFTGLTLATGDFVVVDFDRRTALLDGTVSRTSYIDVSAAWWELSPGGNDLVFTAGGGGGYAEIHYRSSWI
jgi:hypothetical protein